MEFSGGGKFKLIIGSCYITEFALTVRRKYMLEPAFGAQKAQHNAIKERLDGVEASASREISCFAQGPCVARFSPFEPASPPPSHKPKPQAL